MINRVKGGLVRRVVSLEKLVVDQLRVHTCNVRGHEILLHAESEIEKYRANTYSTQEPEVLEWIERFFHPGDVMYDVGANIGLFSLFAARHLQGQCKVYAFEPEALNHASLSKNIYVNGLAGVVIPCCLAVTDQLCYQAFYLNPDNFEKMVRGQELAAGSSLHAFGLAVDYSGRSFEPFHEQGVVGVSIDHLWQVWGLEFPNHLKIDVDGLEKNVIAGAAQTLQDPRLKSVMVEIAIGKGSLDPVLTSLAQAGFVEFTDFAVHSKDQLKGTRFEFTPNCAFFRE